ncbi:hypothetical protein B0H19DRAFT_1348220, partial [Mycena capillaripes]
VFHAATRLATLPSSHPLHRVFSRCWRIPRYHRSPIHHLLGAFLLLSCTMETIDPHHIIAPAPLGLLLTRIAPDKDIAQVEMEVVRRRRGFCVYTDGSGFEGGVGAAAIAWNGDREGACRTKHLGTMGEHTVFEAEVVGAILALDIVKGTPRLTSVDIFTDCQPAITAITNPRPQPGQHLLALFHTLHHRLLHARPTLEVRYRHTSGSPGTKQLMHTRRKWPKAPHPPSHLGSFSLNPLSRRAEW